MNDQAIAALTEVDQCVWTSVSGTVDMAALTKVKIHPVTAM
jgi:hypothetical protein